MSSSQSPLIYFLAGVLLPTIAFCFLRPASTEQMIVGAQKKHFPSECIDDDQDEEEDHDAHHPLLNKDNPSASWGLKDAPFKMVLCVNQDLGMGKGKIAAQCGHAAVGCYKRALHQCPLALSAWERTGCAKIAVKCQDDNEIHIIFENAVQKGIPLYLVEDAGRTQIAAGSRTVLGLGPAPVSVFEGVTSHLKLM